MTFDKIYLTVDSDFKPKHRNLHIFGIILKQIDDLSKHPRFDILEEDHESKIKLIELNTIVARLVHESQSLKSSDDGSNIRCFKWSQRIFHSCD